MRSISKFFVVIAICASICFYLVPSDGMVKAELNEDNIISATFTNYLEWTIYYLFISPYGSEYYGVDVMDSTGALLLAPYESLVLFLTLGDYDIMILDEDYDLWYGSYYIYDGAEIIFSELTLTYEEYGVDDELIYMDIWVETTVAVDFLFLSPADTDEWGVDLLGLYSLEPDDILSVTLPEYDTNMDYDLLAIFENGEYITIDVEAYDGADIYLFEPTNGTGDDDDVVDDDVVADDDDIIPDDDDNTTVDDDDAVTDDDDDDRPPGEEPGAVSGGSLEGDEKKKDSNALGIVGIIAVISVLVGVMWVRRKE
jgi:hypothetical protein